MTIIHKNILKVFFIIAVSLTIYSAVNSEELEIGEQSLFVPHRLGKLKVTHDEEGFHVIKGETRHDVKRYLVDSSIRDLTTEQLRHFLEVGYLSVSGLEDENFSIQGKVRGLGGGPVLGAVGYWTVKGIGYGFAALMAIGAPGCGTASVMAGLPSIVAITETAATSVGVALGLSPTL